MKRKRMISLVLAAILALALGIPAFAAYAKSITVYPGVNIYVDDAKINPTDVNGNSVEVFIYNGTTYLPVRAVSEALDQVVQWDGATNSVYIGKHTGEKPAAWVGNLDYYVGSSYFTLGCYVYTDNLGITHDHCLNDYNHAQYDYDVSYYLNGQYSRLSGVLFQDYVYRSETASTDETTVYIYGDGELLWNGTVSGGVSPMDFAIDVKGVLELEIVRERNDYRYYTHGILGDLGLWT